MVLLRWMSWYQDSRGVHSVHFPPEAYWSWQPLLCVLRNPRQNTFLPYTKHSGDKSCFVLLSMSISLMSSLKAQPVGIYFLLLLDFDLLTCLYACIYWCQAWFHYYHQHLLRRNRNYKLHLWKCRPLTCRVGAKSLCLEERTKGKKWLMCSAFKHNHFTK